MEKEKSVFIAELQAQSSSSRKARNSQSSQELCSLYSHFSVGIHAGAHQVEDPRITNLPCRLHGEEEVSQHLLPPTLQLFPEWDEAFAPQGAEICSMIPAQRPCPVWAGATGKQRGGARLTSLSQCARRGTKPQQGTPIPPEFGWSINLQQFVPQ